MGPLPRRQLSQVRGLDSGYSPMILTKARFRRRPSRLAGQPFRLAPKDRLPGAKGLDELSRVVQPTVCDRYDDLAAHHLPFQVSVAVVPSTPLRLRPSTRSGGASG
jgi:hypothetical protein